MGAIFGGGVSLGVSSRGVFEGCLWGVGFVFGGVYGGYLARRTGRLRRSRHAGDGKKPASPVSTSPDLHCTVYY